MVPNGSCQRLCHGNSPVPCFENMVVNMSGESKTVMYEWYDWPARTEKRSVVFGTAPLAYAVRVICSLC